MTDKNVRAVITSVNGNIYHATTTPVYLWGRRVEFHGYPAECDTRAPHRFEVEYRTVEELAR